jgi:hypothetical protein
MSAKQRKSGIMENYAVDAIRPIAIKAIDGL